MMNFNDAARAAAEEIERAKNSAPDEWFLIPVTEMTEIIAKHFAPLADLNAKLVELAKMIDNDFPIREIISDDGKCYEVYDTFPQPMRALLNAPIVAAAIRDGERDGEVE